MTSPVRTLLDRWPWVALVASGLMLGAAHYAQRVDGLAPCILCLKQREAYWAALAIAAAAIASTFTAWRLLLGRLLGWLLALAFLYGTSMAVYHAGAEYGFWDGPKACAAAGGSSAADIADMLAGKPQKIISCEDPIYWPFPGFITMAGWNVLISLALGIGSILAAFRKQQP